MFSHCNSYDPLWPPETSGSSFFVFLSLRSREQTESSQPPGLFHRFKNGTIFSVL